MVRLQRRHIIGLALAGALSVASAIPAAQAADSAEAAGKKVGERFDVEVLKVSPGDLDGRKVWLVTIMRPGGNRNSAFQVHVLAVDQETGTLVPSFRHSANGSILPPPAPGGERP